MWTAALALAIVIVAVYCQSLNAPFIFDDNATILANDSIVALWPPVGSVEHPGPLRPPAPLPTAGRPLVNLSLAVNYLLGGSAPAGYHVVNVLIHFGSALLLWAIVRRTLCLPHFAGRFESSASWLALGVSLVWALHPLQTEAVVYTTQRTELMVAMFYLVTLYCSLRYWCADGFSTQRAIWLTLAVVACLAGMASKEVMVSAPVIVLLFERTFIAGSMSKALRRSWPLYAGLASTWLLLLLLNMNGPRGDSAGFQGGPSLISYWLTQSQVLLMYLKLVVWPAPLLVHYQLPYLQTFAEAWMYVVPALLLVIVTLVLLWRNQPAGFLGACVFAILAPTSVVPIITEVAAERRMYLPLAALVVLFVVGSYLVVQSLLRRSVSARQSPTGSRLPSALTVSAVFVVALMCGVVSTKHLSAYNDPISLWREVIWHEPNNFVAHGNLGGLLVVDDNCQTEAIEELRTALSLKPDYPDALANLGLGLTHIGRLPEAIDVLQRALKLQPDYTVALNDLGIAYVHAGRLPEAVATLEAVLAHQPDNFNALNNLGLAFTEMGRPAEAIKHLEHALRVEPDNANARNNLGRALTGAGRLTDAIVQLEAARALTPTDPIVLNNLGFALMQLGRLQEAIANFQQSLQARPDYADAHNNLAIALFGLGQPPQAVEHFRLAIKSNPKNASFRANLAKLAAQIGDLNEAIVQYRVAVELQPDQADLHTALADLFRQSGQLQPAIDHYKTALRLNPNLAPAYASLAQTLAAVDRSKEAIAIAQKGIDVARAANQEAAAGQIEDWLSHYQIELRRAADAATSSPAPPNANESKKSQ